MSKATSDAIREREERLHPKPKAKSKTQKAVEKIVAEAGPQAVDLVEWPKE